MMLNQSTVPLLFYKKGTIIKNNIMKNIIALDLGGTAIKFGIINEIGKIRYEDILPTNAESALLVVENLKLAIRKCLKVSEQQKIKVSGVGLGTPGIVDLTYRIVLGGADNIEGWVNVHLAELLEAEFPLPVFLNNDANMMGLGEQWQGAARGCSDVVFLTVGTGIGGAVIIDGKLYGGYANRGTELGHIPLEINGKPCTCGSIGCLEAYASTSALVEEYIALVGSKKTTDEVNGKWVVEEYHKGVPEAVEVMNNHFLYLGRGIAALVNIFSPQKVVIGGGISEAGEFYVENISDVFKNYAMPDCAINTTVCSATLGNKAGLFGATRWALNLLEEN